MRKYSLEFLEKIRAIAQMGLNYTKDHYDTERYEQLLRLCSRQYSDISGLPVDTVIERFRKEIGYITPKVGVNAAVFSNEGRILLVKRTDDRCWCLPCGWADVNETPQESIRREVREETGLNVTVTGLIDIFTRKPGMYGEPHTSYHLMYHCTRNGGAIKTSSETLEVGFFDHRKITRWHRDHKKRARRAYDFWLKNIMHI
jgi:ADP-ribose pyrophosphatase YjhB (NUDIX family)